ncbi:MAG: TolC family protein, partial [Bacteroidetes bacterium]|nr:TolC family protein [Bacteroidota bacterium]
YQSPEIRIPTWYGIEITGGLENLRGNRFDPAETLGKTNYLGIQIPLAKNLLMDKRRALLKQAHIYNSMSYLEQKAVINNILIDAIETYWMWVKEYETYLVVKKNVANNEKRLELLRLTFAQGERAAIDTLEAYSQLQNFQYQENQSLLKFKNYGLELSSFLWTSNNQPFVLPENITPNERLNSGSAVPSARLSLTDYISSGLVNHPELNLYQFKLNMLQIDKQLKFQDLLPKIDFKYNILGKGYNVGYNMSNVALFENNYQYGIKVEVPLRFSLGRGDYKNANLKINEVKLDQSIKKLAIEIKIKTYYNDYLTLLKQIQLQSSNLDIYKQLLTAEETRFSNGESSLFLINSRENKYLEAQEKLIELKAKLYKTIYALDWSAGLLQ